MPKMFSTASIFAAMLLSVVHVAPAEAQATRTWVSGTGNDANPCSRVAPCKTFAGAISKTTPNGEINVIDAGAYGVVTITKSLTINAEGLVRQASSPPARTGSSSTLPRPTLSLSAVSTSTALPVPARRPA